MSAAVRLDPLLWLVLVGTVGLLLPHLPIAALPLVIGAMIWRRLHEVRGWPLPGRWLLGLLAAASAFLVLLQFHALWGRDAGVTLLVLAAALKLLETRSLRDQHSVLLLSFFLLVSVLLFDQAIWIFLLVSILFWLLVGAWLGVTQPVAAPSGRRLRAAGRLVGMGLPFALILFALFPRPPGGLWGAQQPGGQAVTGLSEQMRPGQFDQLASDPTPAFRVRFEGDVIPPPDRYWRVFVMSGFADDDPESWLADPPAAAPRLETLEESRIAYEVTLEPTGTMQLPSLAAAVETPRHTRVDANLVVQRNRPVNDRLRYRLQSDLEYRLDAGNLPRFLRTRYLANAGLNPLLQDLAADWRDRVPAERIEAALAYFRDRDFRYTRSPGRREGADRADTFLFETRRGYCADYADAFTRLMRAADVPARVVTGYQGGEINGDFLVVRQADAHAWSEVWLQGQGWQRIDPTAAVAPERIESGVAQSTTADPDLPATIRRVDDDWSRHLRLWAENMDNRWNQYVLGYDGRIQLDLLRQVGLSALSPLALAIYALALAGLSWLALLWWVGWRQARRAAGSETGYRWQRLQANLAALDLPRRNEESERAFLDRVARRMPREASALRRVGALLEKTRYARYASRRQEALLQTTLTNLNRRLMGRRLVRRLRPRRG
ncbi:DUF3488 and transglutaminase-like domain-containing protein [Guyparkeria sp. 1SP6A2]|nr:DUF3488 and transglutaminase-like domain-containing protein [Guyparkeria sp. 1SP6A2]